jgi:hypothetical protein
MNRSSKILAVALMAAAASWLVAPAAAAPMSQSLGLQNAVAPSVETVQYRRGWGGGYRGGYRGGGLGIGLGLAAGALVGGILGATGPYGYYGYGPGYAYAPGYGYGYGPGYAYAPGYGYGYSPGYGYAAGYGQGYAGGGEVAYCQQRFRSAEKLSDLAKSAASPFLRSYYWRIAERYLSFDEEWRPSVGPRKPRRAPHP